VILRTSEELAPIVTPVLQQLTLCLRSLVPHAEIQHVGSTAIPGALTKGDIDVAVRVSGATFASAVDALRSHFAVKQPQNWSSCFASFGDDISYAAPVGVQLVVRDSEADLFHFVHDHFVAHPEALATYNRVKLESAGKGSDEYWKAKDQVLAPIVALRKEANRVAGGS
jgi:GrpB-like predicted nucleotidyltransferase (UPF0157 family)